MPAQSVTLVRILEPTVDDTIYDPTCGSGGMLVHSADFLRESGHHATSAQYFGQEMNWGNAAIGKINSVLHGLEADIEAGVSTITDPAFKDDEGQVRKFSLVLANFPFSDEFWWLKPEQHTDDKKKKDKLKKEIFGKEGFKDTYGRFGRGTPFKAPPAGYGDYAFILHILASLKRLKELQDIADAKFKADEEPVELNLTQSGEYGLFTVLREYSANTDEEYLSTTSGGVKNSPALAPASSANCLMRYS